MKNSCVEGPMPGVMVFGGRSLGRKLGSDGLRGWSLQDGLSALIRRGRDQTSRSLLSEATGRRQRSTSWEPGRGP